VRNKRERGTIGPIGLARGRNRVEYVHRDKVLGRSPGELEEVR